MQPTTYYFETDEKRIEKVDGLVMRSSGWGRERDTKFAPDYWKTVGLKSSAKKMKV